MFSEYKEVKCDKCGKVNSLDVSSGWHFEDINGKFDVYWDRCECGNRNNSERAKNAVKTGAWM